ncbi:hypothetical protein ABD87_22705 [Lysinibacillus sphaericus]|uniref:hypothetical protein n=1 Tax=Lysinibacillus sphaericus TaxID=1421 RepID=UPI0018CFC622|nr:hypothetical protein [Lysinibacillus sphaericus]MBG9732238.1 hypothetical protein [Lysinibacillus sphaericus]
MSETTISLSICDQIAYGIRNSDLDILLEDLSITKSPINEILSVEVFQNGYDLIKRNAKHIVYNYDGYKEISSKNEAISFEEKQVNTIKFICERIATDEKVYQEMVKNNRLLLTFYDVPYSEFINLDTALIGIRFHKDKHKMWYINQIKNVNTKTQFQCFLFNLIDDIKESSVLPYKSVNDIRWSDEAVSYFLHYR